MRPTSKRRRAFPCRSLPRIVRLIRHIVKQTIILVKGILKLVRIHKVVVEVPMNEKFQSSPSSIRHLV